MNNEQAQQEDFPIPSGASSVLSPEQLEQQLATEDQNWDLLMGWIKKNLTEGVDYGIIEDKQKGFKSEKPSLFKPGAEKINARLRLRSTWERDRDTEEMVNEPGTVCYLCYLIHRQTGEIWSEGRGAAEKGEKKWGVNQQIKMAEKRARVDATLGLGLSDIFTQDLEDMVGNGEAETAEPQFDRIQIMPFGKHSTKGKDETLSWAEAPAEYLNWVVANMDGWKAEFAQQELEIREQEQAKSNGDFTIQRTDEGTLERATLQKIWGLAGQYWGKDASEEQLHLFVKHDSLHDLDDEQITALYKWLNFRAAWVRNVMKAQDFDLTDHTQYTTVRALINHHAAEQYDVDIDALKAKEFKTICEGLISGKLELIPF